MAQLSRGRQDAMVTGKLRDRDESAAEQRDRVQVGKGYIQGVGSTSATWVVFTVGVRQETCQHSRDACDPPTPRSRAAPPVGHPGGSFITADVSDG